jgi:undecaprenyl diphosphate synthase
LVFTSRLWPEFAREDLEGALNDFASRERRFGGLPSTKEVVSAGAV